MIIFGCLNKSHRANNNATHAIAREQTHSRPALAQSTDMHKTPTEMLSLFCTIAGWFRPLCAKFCSEPFQNNMFAFIMNKFVCCFRLKVNQIHFEALLVVGEGPNCRASHLEWMNNGQWTRLMCIPIGREWHLWLTEVDGLKIWSILSADEAEGIRLNLSKG